MAEFPMRMVVGAALVVVAGCAQQAVRPAPGAALTASPTPTHVASSPKAWPDGVSPHVLQLARDAGYHPIVSNGHTVFCRIDIPTGSTLPSRHCVNSASLRLEVQREQYQRQQLREGIPSTLICVPGSVGCAEQ